MFADRAQRGFALACLLVFAAALGLGVWQVQRLGWKRDLIARMQAQLAAPAVALPPGPAPGREFDYRRVRISGHYLPGTSYLLGPRSHGDDSGFHLLTILALADGRHLLVNRGWVPADWQAGVTRPPGDDDEVMLTGVLRTQFGHNYWTPDYDRSRRLWFWYDVTAIARQSGTDLLPAVLELDAQDDHAGPPLAGVTRIDLPNNHLQYAITWFALAGVVAIMFAVYRHRQGHRH